jgi:hypothetical protein
MALISRVETDDFDRSSVPGDIMRSRNALASGVDVSTLTISASE